MRRFFVPTSTSIAIAAIFCQGVVCAEDVKSAGSDDKVQAIEVAAVGVVKEAPLFRHDTYPSAWTAAQKSNRPILVYVSMPNCPYCVKMIKKTYELPEVGRLVKSSFEPIYADKTTHSKLIEKLDVKWYPTTILVGPNNKILDVIEGYVEAKAFQRRLQTGLAATSTETQTR